MPDTAADALLNLLCSSLLFLLLGGALVTTKCLFTPSRGNRAECGSDNLENLFKLVWQGRTQAGC